MSIRLFSSVVFFLATVVVCLVLGLRARHQRLFFKVCDMVERNYYEVTPEFIEWLKECRIAAIERGASVTTDTLVSRLELVLRSLNVSHLAMTSPVQNRKIWHSEYREVGLRIREVEGYFVVKEVLPDSSAMDIGVQVGDMVASINGESIYSEDAVQYSSGWYVFIRKNQALRYFLEPRPFVLNEAPRLKHLNESNAVLEISSFRGDHFEGDKWMSLVTRLSGVKHLTIDLRGNRGGNFVAMLRVLSTFMCRVDDIGQLYHSRQRPGSLLRFPDDLRQEAQLYTVDRAKKIRLSTFNGYGCYDKKVSVLMDENTASVAEIFALALREFKRARLFGHRSAGDVLLAVIFPLPDFGGDYSLYIPQMGYISRRGNQIEQNGVEPDQFLDYSLKEAQEGIDSWLKVVMPQ